MANTKISALPAASALAVTDTTVVVQGGVTKRATEAQVAAVANLRSGIINVRDYGAVGDGVTNDSVAFQTANNAIPANAAGEIIVPPGSYSLVSATARGSRSPMWRMMPGASIVQGVGRLDGSVTYHETPFLKFGTRTTNAVARWDNPSGTPPSEYINIYGPVTGVFTAADSASALLGIVNNTSSTASFPTGVSGIGHVNAAGGTAFGIFGASHLRAVGVATNELNSFNWVGTPSANLPPDRSFGTTQTQPIVLTVASGGDYPSSIGVHFCREGGAPQPMRTGIYFSPDAVTEYGVFIDATSTEGPVTPLVLKHRSDTNGMVIQTEGTVNPSFGWMTYIDGTGVTRFSIRQNGDIYTNGRLRLTNAAYSQTTVGVAGAAAVLPSNPVEYIVVVTPSGFERVIPCYVK